MTWKLGWQRSNRPAIPEFNLTPAIQTLQKQGIDHAVHRYEVAGNEEVTYGEAVAAAIGADPAKVFKTLIAQLSTGELVVAIVPVAQTLDLRVLASAAEAKSAEMAKPALAEKSTGYVTGGISPFGQMRKVPTAIEVQSLSHERVYINGGQRGLQVRLDPNAAARVLAAITAPLIA